ncbi:uncharacterized protein LOC108276956 isoform X3 [Ictalurus punctatus]|uniref:Uncharacterized protein LOC108276956 isoform X3 n=1 Tax=Ictalurus punctatus TaxID=7998 RepID=A0A2D0SPJ2_ICTPU|nr:uncharacterized protein LOC108276956 isoform X3 [Ictalurus punctatus]
MFSGTPFCLLLALPFYYSTNIGALDITVSSGDTAFLPCPLLFNYTDFMRIGVKWEKDGGSILCTYSIQNNAIHDHNCKPRFKVNTEPLGLNITSVESSDAGLYKCLMIRLIPPTPDERSVTLRLKVNVLPSLTLQLTNSTNFSCVELLCSLQGLRPEQVNFTWTRATQFLHHHPESRSMNSTLMLCKPNWTDRETLTCHASYSHNHIRYSKSITLPCNSDSSSFFNVKFGLKANSSVVRFIVIGTLFASLICTALFFEVYYQCLAARRRQ